MLLDVLTLAIGIATGLLLYDVVTNWLEMHFGQQPTSDDDDDKEALGW